MQSLLSGSNRYTLERRRSYNAHPIGSFRRWAEANFFFGQRSIAGTFAWPRSVAELPAPADPEEPAEEPAV